MRNRTIVAVSAAAAAAAAISGGAASASTPDWLTLANVESEHDSVLPSVCDSDQTGPLTGTACESLLGSDSADDAEAFGEEIPEMTEDGGGLPSLANVDLRNFAKWKVCGVSVAASVQGPDCDNSIQGPKEPVGPGSGISLVNADTTGAFQWAICGFAVGQSGEATSC